MSDMSLINLTTRVSSEEAIVETLDAGPQPVTTKLGEKMSSGCDKKKYRGLYSLVRIKTNHPGRYVFFKWKSMLNPLIVKKT